MRPILPTLVLVAAAACHHSSTAVAPPAAAPHKTPAPLATREEPLPPDMMRLDTKHDDPHNVAIVQGREGADPTWAQTIAALEAAEDRDPFALFHSSHSLLMRGQIVWKEVNRELTTLNTATSYYSHSTYMNEETNTRRTDCSGFVDYAIRRVLPEAYDKVPHPDTQRPLANDWYKYLKERYQTASTQESIRWREIIHVRDLMPGDLVVWLRPENVSGDNTGHIMVVAAKPTTGRPSEWLVRIVDSTTSPHANDTRGTTRTGIGSGTIGLKVDSWDRPIAYWWRGGLSYNAYDTPIAMGRVE
jgi:hypothetical protein